MRAKRAVGLTVGAVVIVALPSLLAVGFPALRLRLDSPTAGPVAVTARLLAELLVAALAARRYRRTAGSLEFGVAAALALMAVADALLLLMGRELGVDAAPGLPYVLLGAGLLTLVALLPERPLSHPLRRRAVSVAALALAIALLGLAPRLHPGGSAVGVLRGATCALLACAAVVVVTRPASADDGLLRWLGAALVLLALAQLVTMLAPADPPTAFAWPDVLALAAAAALIGGAIEGICGDERRFTALSMAAERRRMARELHDGLAQEIAFISAQARYLAEDSDDERAKLIATSAQCALDDARVVVGSLTRATGMPLGASLAAQASEFARRWGLRVELDIDSDIDVPPEHEHAILRIVGEAIANAARHADARTVQVRADYGDDRLRVAIKDDGRGFDAAAEDAAATGFGLRSMRERAQLLGGQLELESPPGAGTRVELALACSRG